MKSKNGKKITSKDFDIETIPFVLGFKFSQKEIISIAFSIYILEKSQNNDRPLSNWSNIHRLNVLDKHPL